METKITLTFGSIEEALEALTKMNEEETTNQKIEKKIKEEKVKNKRKTKKKTKEEPEEDAIPFDDVLEACEQHAAEFGKRKTKKILQKFGADKPSEMKKKKSKYADCLAALVEDMENAEEEDE